MSLNSKVLLADVHTPEYLLHKYWARKPHNIIAEFLAELVPEEGVVIDPFCGSGVIVREAQKANKAVFGIDINPIAILNTKVLTNPPEVKLFERTVIEILHKAEKRINESYYVEGQGRIRYLIHSMVVKCNSCESEVVSEEAVKKGTKYYCPQCKQEIRFNLENLVSTKVVGCCVEKEKDIIYDEVLCRAQQTESIKSIFDVDEREYEYPFEENRRILAYDGMTTKNLFTQRNFNILCYIASEFHKISDERVRDAAILLLTASVAQCSRLIPCRNNLSTGGPAWSVPGFWVPAQHLETNPIMHLYARIKKFEKGLANIACRENNGKVLLTKGNALVELGKISRKADLIFLDPPYGDNVPYTEFSAMWNSFLREQPVYEDDISVSDRKPRNIAWNKYGLEINEIIRKCPDILKVGGHLLITFNNNDLRAWEALLGSLQRNGFVCDYISYVIPAVVSSKAQFSPKGSYITDIYAVYSYNPDLKRTSSLNSVTNALMLCASARRGGVAKNLVYRTIMIEWIKNNIDSDLLYCIPDIVSSLFVKKGDMYHYIGTPIEQFELKEEVKLSAKEILAGGPCEWKELYKNIAEKYIEYGFLDSSELREYLSGNIVSNKGKCISYKE